MISCFDIIIGCLFPWFVASCSVRRTCARFNCRSFRLCFLCLVFCSFLFSCFFDSFFSVSFPAFLPYLLTHSLTYSHTHFLSSISFIHFPRFLSAKNISPEKNRTYYCIPRNSIIAVFGNSCSDVIKVSRAFFSGI